MSLIFLFSRGSLYDQVGESGFATEQDTTPDAPAPAPGSIAERDEQEREIRQMLRARSARMVGRGEPALDIDAELAALSRPQGVDAGLRDEVRQLVIARNERRIRRGEEPLDVEAEVERQLRDAGA